MKSIWYKKNNFISINPITQVYGVCFDNSGNILIMRTPGKLWNIPGGTPETNENPKETLKRELREEVDVSIGLSEMIGYFKVVSNKSAIYQLRYATLINKINPQSIDPAINKINERKFIKPDEFFDYIKYDEYHPMLVAALEWYKKNKVE